MSALIGHIAYNRAMAQALRAKAEEPGLITQWRAMCNVLADVHDGAAQILEDQARREASGPEFKDRPQPPRKR